MPTDDDPFIEFGKLPHPFSVTCPRCKKKILKFPSWFEKKGVSCPKCGTPLPKEAIFSAANRKRKSMDKVGKRLSNLSHILANKSKL
jgi:predicted amidophosphoribosyltransferase